MTDRSAYTVAFRRHRAWQRRVNKRLPEWGTRVFALRGKAYWGYGLHYTLEASYGAVIRIANTYDRTDMGELLVDEVVVESFVAELVRAERSVPTGNS